MLYNLFKQILYILLFDRKVIEMTDLNIIGKKKGLLYVAVYNKLFKMINEGTFPENTRLPSEPELAKELGISRSTLRQALALLQDDGLIKNIHGKGNYITKQLPPKEIGLEKIGHIVYKCIEEKIDTVEIDFTIEPPSDYYTKVFKKKTAATVCVDRWYTCEKGTLAYTFTIIPIETISELNINLNNKDELLTLLESETYELCTNSSVEFKFSTFNNFRTKKLPLSAEKFFYLIEEKIYKNSEFPLMVSKHYLPLQYTSIKFHPTK